MLVKTMKPTEKKYWQIIHNGEYYLTTDPIISGECVYFTDENGQSKIICGYYKLKRL